mmetsp:Transcript_82421/g.218705  ORF Transcript_82421/g.218705 Transcript_82421/m.218705 type:complete len:82 (-) Transcript_82421:13-258(-)
MWELVMPAYAAAPAAQRGLERPKEADVPLPLKLCMRRVSGRFAEGLSEVAFSVVLAGRDAAAAPPVLLRASVEPQWPPQWQ